VALPGLHRPLEVAPVQAHHLVVQHLGHVLSGHPSPVLVIGS
jgi:hypothetical protein